MEYLRMCISFVSSPQVGLEPLLQQHIVRRCFRDLLQHTTISTRCTCQYAKQFLVDEDKGHCIRTSQYANQALIQNSDSKKKRSKKEARSEEERTKEKKQKQEEEYEEEDAERSKNKKARSKKEDKFHALEGM